MSTIARPFGVLLMFLYEWVNNYGLAIIMFAIIVRGILLPFQMKSKPGMMRQTRLQPKVNEIQKKYASNKTKVNEELAKLYKEEGVNPASGCVWGLLPFPIMIALFLVIRQPLTMMMGIPENLLQEGGALLTKINEVAAANNLVSTIQPYYLQIDQAQWITRFFEQFQSLDIAQLHALDFSFIGINLGAQPQWNFLWTTDWSNASIWLPGLALFIIPLLSGGSQFIASAINRKMTPPPSQDGQGKSMQTMMMLMPLMSVYFAFITPAALGFYWTIGTVLQIVQDIWLTKRYTRILDAEEAVRNEERKKKEIEIEAKRLETERKKAEGQMIERNPNTSKRKKLKSDKQEQIEKATEWEKKNMPADSKNIEPSRVDNRRYARGRAYDPDRYTRLSDSMDSNDYSELSDESDSLEYEDDDIYDVDESYDPESSDGIDSLENDCDSDGESDEPSVK